MENRVLTIFDLDDTLIQTSKATARDEKEFFAAHGLFYTRRERLARLAGQSYEIFIINLRDDFRRANGGQDAPASFEADLRNLYRDSLARGIEMMPGATDLLHWMRQENHARCIASNSNSVFLPWKLEISGLDAHFNFHADAHGFRNAFSKDDVGGRGKPLPHLPLYAALKMGGYLPPHCIMVEDSAPGVRAGHASGMYVIAYAGDPECDDEEIEMLRAAGANVIASNMEDVRKAIEQRHEFLFR